MVIIVLLEIADAAVVAIVGDAAVSAAVN